MSARVLKRPYGGWGARQWRRGALGGLLAAFWVVGSWAALNTAVALVGVLAGL